MRRYGRSSVKKLEEKRMDELFEEADKLFEEIKALLVLIKNASSKPSVFLDKPLRAA